MSATGSASVVVPVSSSRRDQILATAAALFAEHGYHGVSVGELCAACGVSGPALYRHFASKSAVLAEMLVAISDRLLVEGRSRVAAARERADRTAALTAAVGWHVEFALDNPDLIVVQERDWAALPDDARDQVRRLQRRYVEVWVEELRRLRPELEPAVARARVQATFGLLNSTPHSARIGRSAMAGLLERMAMAALLAN